jgi:hypothetical protein
VLAVGEGEAIGTRVWRSLRASWACGLTETEGVVLTDWIMTMVARTESSRVSRCFRWSATTPSEAVGRDVVGL